MKFVILTESRADWPGLSPVYSAAISKGHSVLIYAPYDFTPPTELPITKGFHGVKFYNPDCIILLGDRKRVLLQAISFRESGFPICHLSGGDTQEANLIDESCRRAITAFSDVHMPTNKYSAERIYNTGEEKIYNVGSTFVDNLKNFKPLSAQKEKYAVALVNPEPGWLDMYDFLVRSVDMPIIWVKPNEDYGGLTELENKIKSKFVNFESQFAFLNCCHGSYIVISNSSATRVELQYLGIPVVQIGERNSDRLEAFPGHSINLPKLTKKALEETIKKALLNDKRNKEGVTEERLKKGVYGDGKSAYKIIGHLEGLIKLGKLNSNKKSWGKKC